ncbi:MAG: right-handed parallel beta-helix repeat-containing protein, partial [Oscillospiraceae bacterium]|nr:right-handed parallel beta-helix repeat-containing protein [Oscillospiraceae bacterium]
LRPGSGPALRRSGAVYSPMLLGLLRPVIVLPERDYSPEMLRGILAHELTHYRRGDLALKWFAAAVCSVHWFNPVTLLLRRELDRACELSCDERLLRGMGREEKQRYGELLLRLAAERPLPRRVVAVSFATEKRNLRERLMQIMKFKKTGKGAFAAMLAAAMLLAGCGAAAGPSANSAPLATPSVTPTPAATVASAPTPEPTAAPAPEKPETVDTYEVHTVDEFLAALGSNRYLTLDAGTFDLSEAQKYGADGEHYVWEFLGDGYGLRIFGLENLEIAGSGMGETVISAEPRYADVLTFDDCRDIILTDLTAGHTREPGFCAGGVLEFHDSDNILVENCGLYGCGTVGITAVNCRGLTAARTSIYECSYGAIEASGCYDLRFLNGEIHDCGRKTEDFTCFDLLSAVSTTGFVLYNTAIYDNSTEVLLRSNYSAGVELRGCEVRGNRISEAAFSIRGSGPLVEGCALAENTLQGEWYAPGPDSSTRAFAHNAAGEALSQADFMAMGLKAYTGDYDGPVLPSVEKPEGTLRSDGVYEYHVATVDEFLACLDSDTRIYLDMDHLDFSRAMNYGGYGGQYYYWRDDYDGPSLVISGVRNLSIIGKGVEETVVEAHPRYAMVLSFFDCSNVLLEGVTAGHTRGQGVCSGDVLEFASCYGCEVKDCGLFGCGVNGVSAWDCVNLSFSGTEIYECSGNAAVISECADVSFTNCVVRNCGVGNQILDYGSGVAVDEKTAETAQVYQYK